MPFSITNCSARAPCSEWGAAIPNHQIAPMMLKRLHDETSERHAALEQRLPLLDPQLSRKSYRCLVTKFHGYYAPLEERMLALPWWEEISFDYVERLKTPRLEQDLIALGGTADELAKNPRCGELPRLFVQLWEHRWVRSVIDRS